MSATDAGMPSAGRDLLVFCDGTSNTLTAGRHDTHVLRLYEHVAAQLPRPGERERVLYYDPGVGAPDAAPPTDPLDLIQRAWGRLAGLASGRGIYDNVGQAYLFLMRHWRGPQDRIFVFGFSRGAFTARAVAGMVHRFGLLEAQHETLVPTLLSVYFSHAEDKRPWYSAWLYRAYEALLGEPRRRAAIAGQIRGDFTDAAGAMARIHWVGLWDTVESVGLAIGLRQRFTSGAELRGKRITHVRQALALDEHRLAFTPQLYDEPADIATLEQTLKQRWFAGAHMDVGGGTPAAESGLADDTLAWMVAELAPELPLTPLRWRATERVRHDQLYASPWWALAGMTLRRHESAARPGEPIAVLRADVPPPDREVWQRRRPLLPLALAAFVGFASLVVSGKCIADVDLAWSADALGQQLTATSAFAFEQLASLWGQGLQLPGHAPWSRGGRPGWAMLFDLVFVACWAYVLARIASRSFAWLVRGIEPGAARPRWLWLGLAPLIAVLGDIGEDLLTWFALALNAAAVPSLLVRFTLHLVGAASAAKLLGLAACVPLLAVRYWLSFEPRGGFGRARRRAGHLYALVLPGVLLLMVWGTARTFVCWGGHGWLGDLVCHGHYAIGLLLAAGLASLWWLRRDLLEGGRRASTWQGLQALERGERRHVGWSAGLTLALLLMCVYLLLVAPIRF